MQPRRMHNLFTFRFDSRNEPKYARQLGQARTPGETDSMPVLVALIEQRDRRGICAASLGAEALGAEVALGPHCEAAG
jgi:hypothetical protein